MRLNQRRKTKCHGIESAAKNEVRKSINTNKVWLIRVHRVVARVNFFVVVLTLICFILLILWPELISAIGQISNTEARQSVKYIATNNLNRWYRSHRCIYVFLSYSLFIHTLNNVIYVFVFQFSTKEGNKERICIKHDETYKNKSK